MEKTVYILKYQDGSYVKRDDSIGPMSSGGYPYRVNDIEKATRWDDLESASRYASHFQSEFRNVAYPITILFDEGDGVALTDFWESCNRKCAKTPASMSPSAKHFLDCPIMVEMNKR